MIEIRSLPIECPQRIEPCIAGEGISESEVIRRELAEQAGIEPVEVNIEDVGPTWGGEISRKAAIGLFGSYGKHDTVDVHFRRDGKTEVTSDARVLP